MNDMKAGGLVTVTAALLLGACGGGGGSGGSDAGGGGSAGIDGTGQPTPITAVGTVTAFGSVYVNGVRYDTSSASFTIDGAPGTQDDLDVGDVVLLSGSLDDDSATSGTADAVIFDDNVEGPIASIDAAAGTFVTLGQLVRVTADTSFDDSFQPASFDALQPGDVVEVSGLVESDGSIAATRIEPKPDGGELELTGRVSALDAGNLRFSINLLSIDYSGAMLEGFPGGAPADGDLVEVKGAELSQDGALLATRVERKSVGEAQAGERLEVEGFITRFDSSSDFDVAGFPARTTLSTQFEGGSAQDLGLDIKVEAEGRVDSAGVLVATKIDIRRSHAVRALAIVDSVDAAHDTFVVLSIPVDVDALTRIEDKSGQSVEPFGIEQLSAGDYVELRGAEFPAGSGRILAGLVEREDLDSDTELQGFVTQIQQPSFEVLGVAIWTDAGTVFRDAGGAVMDSAAFFAALDSGDLVKTSGVEVPDGSITADEVQFEIE